jgi:hypothetical protein
MNCPLGLQPIYVRPDGIERYHTCTALRDVIRDAFQSMRSESRQRMIAEAMKNRE